MKRVLFVALAALPAYYASCEISVTASRAYVDRKTSVTSVTNNGKEVGFFIGTNTNKVFASTNFTSSASPSQIDLTPATNYTDFAIGLFANTGSVNNSKSLYDGTNKIDPAGNVYKVKAGWSALLSASGVASSATPEEIVEKMDLGDPVYGSGTSAMGDPVTGWFVPQTQAQGEYDGLLGYDYIGVQGGPGARELTYNSDFDWDGEGSIVTISGSFMLDAPVVVGKLALTNDIPEIPTGMKSDRITDGTNTIDAARNVFSNSYSFTEWTFSQSGMNFSQPEFNDGQWGCSVNEEYGGPWISAEGQADATTLHFVDDGYGVDCIASRTVVTSAVLVGRLLIQGELTAFRTKTDLKIYKDRTTHWACSGVYASGDYASKTNLALWTFTEYEFEGDIYPTIFYDGEMVGACNSPIDAEDKDTVEYWNMFFDEDLTVEFSRDVAGTATGDILATTNQISATNPMFSNAVLSVGIGVGTNTIAAINELVENNDRLPIGGAATVGALLLALAAAVAALKKKKQDALHIGDVGWSYSAPYGEAGAAAFLADSDNFAVEITGGPTTWTCSLRGYDTTAYYVGDTVLNSSVRPTDIYFTVLEADEATSVCFVRAVLGTGQFVDSEVDTVPTENSAHLVTSGGVQSALAGKADKSDLPYAMVEPGKWSFSGVPSGFSVLGISYSDVLGEWIITIDEGGSEYDLNIEGSETDTSLSFLITDVQVTATRTPPGHVLDRAVNAVPVSSATEITLPEKIAGGKSRDFYVRLSVSAKSAVTFAATDSGGYAVTWDDMGDPSREFDEGTYLYRITETDEGLMHAEDMMALEGVEDAIEQINNGTATPSALDSKLNATSAAPSFSSLKTYAAGDYVTYLGVLFRCSTAVTVPGEWTGASNWEYVDMTSPDATLDIRSDGRLEVVSSGGETLWIQGYDMSSASSVSLSCERVNLYAFASGTTTQAFDMPSVPGGKVGDFVLDVDNSANASDSATATLNGFGTSFDVFTPEGQNLLTDILTFEGGEKCELYFTMTAFGTSAKPAWKVVKQVVEKQEAGS